MLDSSGGALEETRDGILEGLAPGTSLGYTDCEALVSDDGIIIGSIDCEVLGSTLAA